MAQNMAEKNNSLDRSLTLPVVKKSEIREITSVISNFLETDDLNSAIDNNHLNSCLAHGLFSM